MKQVDSLLYFPWVLLNIFLSKQCYLLQVACVHNYSKNINKVTVLFNYIEIQPYQSNKILYENNFKPSVNYIVMISSCFQFIFTLVFSLRFTYNQTSFLKFQRNPLFSRLDLISFICPISHSWIKCPLICQMSNVPFQYSITPDNWRF